MINLIHNYSMNNVVLLLVIFLATLGLTQTSSGLTLGMSSEQILETQQLILLGTVDSVEARSGDTEYDITVLEYVKIPAGFNKVDTLHVVGCGEGQIGGCITFDEGQDVLFILDERNNTLLVSELSFVSPNPNCTMDEIFRYNDEKYGGLSLYQGSKNNHYLYTNQPIIAQYYYFNKNLEATSVDVTIKVVDNFPDILKEETIRLDLKECQPNAKAEMEFVIDSPGSFAISAKVEGNGGGEAISGVKVIDYVVPPLKQFKSGIPIDEIQCKEGLELILRTSDSSPTCVKPETKKILIEREWAKTESIFSSVESNYDPYNTRCGSGVVPAISTDWQLLGMTPSDKNWESLGRYLIQQKFYQELKNRNIIFTPACFGIHTGPIEESYPPRFAMCSTVTGTNGTQLYLEGTVYEFNVTYFNIGNEMPYECGEHKFGCLCQFK